MDNAIISILGIDNIFDEGHMYKPEVCTKLYILRLGIFNSFGLLHSQFNVFKRTQACCLNVQYSQADK